MIVSNKKFSVENYMSVFIGKHFQSKNEIKHRTRMKIKIRSKRFVESIDIFYLNNSKFILQHGDLLDPLAFPAA